MEVDIRENDLFVIHNGRELSSDVIARFSGDETEYAYDISMTTQQYALVRFETQDYANGKHGVIFKYFQGEFILNVKIKINIYSFSNILLCASSLQHYST